MSYLEEAYQRMVENNPEEPEFHRAVWEVFSSARPVIEKKEKQFREGAVLERLAEPERSILFRVPWVDDQGMVRINHGWRIQFSSAIGPYKGGIRFRDTVNAVNLKQAAFEQTLKNALTDLPIGGAKGGSDFDRRGKSDREIRAFCQSFMQEFFKHTGESIDIPTADFGAGEVEIGYLYGEYKRLTGAHEGAITGKGISFGGTFVRTQACGYGVVYSLEAMLRHAGMKLKGKRVVISGSGKVALHAADKLVGLGAKVVALSDSDGFIYDPRGLCLDRIHEIKQEVREGFWGRLSEYAALVPGSVYKEGHGIWGIPCEIALPCAVRHEIGESDLDKLMKNGCLALAEGALEPLTPRAQAILAKQQKMLDEDSRILYLPGKIAGIGGVVMSTLELAQNTIKHTWSFEEADAELNRRMHQIFFNCAETAARYQKNGDYLAGANLFAFEKLTEAIERQGYI